MKLPAKFLALILLCLLVPSSASTYDDPCSNYLVPLVLRDSKGEMIHDVSPKDLDVKLNGKTVPLETIQREERPRRIVILLDASGSMRGLGDEVPWRQAVTSADMLATLSGGRARLALLIFNERVIEEIDFGPDNSAVRNRLSELEKDREFEKRAVYGPTSMNDALTKALQLLPHPTSADALYLATDGEENSSNTGRSEIESKIGSSGVRIFMSLLETPGAHRAWRPGDMGSTSWAIDITRQSGGGLMIVGQRELQLGFKVRRKLSLLEAIQLFFESVFENSILQLSVPNQTPEKDSLQIAPSPGSRDLLKGTQFFYPRNLHRCQVQQGRVTAH